MISNSDKGKFNPVTGHTCSECPAGYFQDQNTIPSPSCKACPTGYNSTISGSSTCSDLGGVKPSDCKDDEYYNVSLLDCERCPRGSSCLGSITFSQVKAKFGWQQCSNNPHKFEQCSFSGACLGGPNPALEGKVNDSKLSYDPALCPDCKLQGNDRDTCSNCTAQCNKEYVNGSRLCGQCAPNYSLDGLSGKCQQCPDPAQNTAFSVLGVFAGIIGLFGFVRITLSDGGDVDESDGVKTIATSFVQLLSLLFTFPIEWPRIFISIFQVGGAITAVGTHLMNLKCMFPHLSEADVFFNSKIMWAVVPPVLVFLCAATWILVNILYGLMNCSEENPNRFCRIPFFFEITNLNTKMKSSCVALLYFVWPSLCSETFSLFACRSVCGDDVTYLRADLNEKCWEGRHAMFAGVLGIPMLLLYVMGLTVGALYQVWQVQLAARTRAAAEMTAEVRASKRRRGSTIHYNRETVEDDHKIYGMFFSAFHENTWWWEFTIAARKIFIAMIGVFGANMKSMQIHVTLLLIVIILLITAQIQPFGGARAKLLLALELASLMATFLTLWAGSVFNEHPKCQDPMQPEGVTLAWCEALSVSVGLVDIVLVVILAVCFVWLKTIGGTAEENDGEEKEEEEEETTVVRRGSLWSAIGDQLDWLKSRMMSEEQRQARTRRRTVDAADNNALTNPAMSHMIEMPPISSSAGEVKVVEEEEGESGAAPFMSPPPPLQMNFRRQVEGRVERVDMHTNPMERN